METKDVIYKLRTKSGLSQDELAEKVFVTRQAVSRWENGETVPNTETLKLLSEFFDVSINTLLGSAQQLVCRCCGMPVEETDITKEYNSDADDYCRQCYADAGFPVDFLDRYEEIGGREMFEKFKGQIMDEINALACIEGLPKVEKLNILPGSFVNLEYRLPNGSSVKFLDDNATYLGTQLMCEFGIDRCFGIVANADFILVCTYEENGENPELVLFKNR